MSLTTLCLVLFNRRDAHEAVFAKALTALLLILSLNVSGADSSPPPLPPSILEAAPGLKYVGGGLLRVFGFRIYNAYYWAENPERGWQPDEVYVLDIHYHRNFTAQQLADRSIEEWAKQDIGAPDLRSAWGAKLAKLFPDTYEGQRLTGVNVPGVGVTFYERGKFIGEIDDPHFAEAFFAIWLSPKTSQPNLRDRLLGKS